jgi:hypothetical protein
VNGLRPPLELEKDGREPVDLVLKHFFGSLARSFNRSCNPSLFLMVRREVQLAAFPRESFWGRSTVQSL